MGPRDRGRPRRGDYITLDEAAGRIGVHKRTIERMMDDGKLKFRTTPGGYRRLYRTSVDDYCSEYVDNGGAQV